jgi:hypothetical protein
MLRLDQERELVLVRGIQQFQVESLVDAMPCRHRPRSPVIASRFIKPAVGCLAGFRHRVIPRLSHNAL